MDLIRTTRADGFGLVHPALDAHTLGISSVAQLLEDCGLRCAIADAATCRAFNTPEDPGSMTLIQQWIREHRVTQLGFSYRLGPESGAALFARLWHELTARRLHAQQGGPLRGLYFAGLPAACEKVRRECPEVAAVFHGDETPAETLRLLGVGSGLMPRAAAAGIPYDDDRLAFGKDLIRRGGHLAVKPVDRGGYAAFGRDSDTVIARLQHSLEHRLPPLMRAHVGPYLPDREEAVRLFLQWTRQLAATGLLDVLSIGTSQLTQSAFGEQWGARPNGGGVPLNSREEFAAVWTAARPMLVRTYAGTDHVPALARLYEETIHIAWHALSLWWFCQVDGRGPHSVRENLQEHFDALRSIASTGKPFEANVSHHFAFRGADDVTYVVAAAIAARVAKAQGIRYFILQNMLNTPKYTWGVQDLAKARAMLQLARELEDGRFHVILQPRGGLDYFSPDLDKARAQLAAVTALMDDIEPHQPGSPPLIHVVSWSEASHLADPPTVNESIQITRHALDEYRRLRVKGEIDDMARHPEVLTRTAELASEARVVLDAIAAAVPNLYTPEGLYQLFARGFLPVPYLWECKQEFRHATRWQTRVVRGSVKVVNEQGVPISASERMREVVQS